ncbi:MAG: Rieske 2Fe-2S domain-containing protein [Bacteroidetes bacterium]|nr:Rieske 2Fe-2S domain-containing protein [Bacteroidota bacterium]MBK9541760.1 Rieske 2Fe-2S domain-containing protein [Bacteroidota bacterium]
MSNRREFIKQGTQASLGSCLALSVFSSVFESCKTAALTGLTIEENEISFHLSSFGSKKIIFISDERLKDEVVIVKKKDGTYYAMKMQCTHQMNPVRYTGDSFFCPTHGSTFDMEGKPTTAPAMRPLQRFTTIESGTRLIVKLT